MPPPTEGNRLDHYEGIEGSETRRAFGERVYEVMTALEADPAPRQVVVTHGFAVTFVIAAWIGMPLVATGHVHFLSSSGGLSILGEDDYFHNRTVLSLDETAHLPTEGG